ncbi:hypothetical protein FZ983_28520 [Azospirillum sp. B21]|uniref:LuxR C-terminal-related transcriptional regulator n=1 Tax=Azospirillum sp. B21 TaxID=2607496 RepID=UPI0011EFBCF0|nr:LuxR C-terminal-related transcriptional regulator [Azospirillum sp. B21]KAA0574197.1 hypothetical protein FZ983_28520 [Azospirillum sp. B21]
MRIDFLDNVRLLDSCETAEDVVHLMDGVARKLGFSGVSFLDVRMISSGARTEITPYYLTTARTDFIADYAAQRMYEIDPVAHEVRRTNLAFSWSELMQRRASGARSGSGEDANAVMGFAFDHGYQNGLTLPFHGVSADGSPVSSLTTMFWSESGEEFDNLVADARLSLQMFIHCCNDRVAVIRGSENTKSVGETPTLSARERDCLSWGAQGKTAAEVGIILGISENTVNFHFKNVMRKLSVHTKTHAVTRAISLGLIAP